MKLKFRKKPVVIEAFQMTKERRINNTDWPSWMHGAWQLERETPGSLYPTEVGNGDGTVSIGTLEGNHLVSFGDWIIQGVNGELYPCKPDIFEKTYEEV
ncbi:pgdyg protein [Caudoviricetes sp.]|nr:pgdyg protein [Caudoviricetes sp.]